MVSWIFAASGLVLLFLLCPDGQFLSTRWRSVLWLWGAGALLALPGWTLNHRLAREYADGVNPFAAESSPADLVFGVGAALTP